MTALTPHFTWTTIPRLLGRGGRRLFWYLCGPMDPDPRGALPWWAWLSH